MAAPPGASLNSSISRSGFGAAGVEDVVQRTVDGARPDEQPALRNEQLVHLGGLAEPDQRLAVVQEMALEVARLSRINVIPCQLAIEVRRGRPGVLASGATRERLQAQGLSPVGNRPVQFKAQIQRETAIWVKVIQEAGIKPE